MDSNLINISKIETFFDGLFRSKLSKNIFYTALPEAIKDSWSEMVLVDVASAIEDLGGYGKGVVNVFLYPKPLASGAKNIPVISKLEKTLNDIIASNKDAHYFISRLNTYPDYDEQRRLYCSVVSLTLQIV